MKLMALLLCFAPAAALAGPRPPSRQPLYFAVELRKDGRVVGAPRLLGLEGRPITVERRQPGAERYDYRLVLQPNLVGGRYRVGLDVDVPGAQGHSDVTLLHGEVKRLEVGPIQVELMVLKVDSPEFRALMDAAGRERAAGESI